MAKYLYHYSTLLYDQLESRAKQKDISEKELEKSYKIEVVEYCNPNVYDKQISFFIDPIPLKTIAGIFEHKHEIWVSGKELYMYVVNIDTLPKDIEYFIAESKIATKMLEDTYREWPADEKSEEFQEYLKKFKCKKLKALKENKDIGWGKDNLIHKLDEYEGQTTDYFKKARDIKYHQDPNILKDLYIRYAQGVPHVMLYPNSGIIGYQSVKKVKIV